MVCVYSVVVYRIWIEYDVILVDEPECVGPSCFRGEWRQRFKDSEVYALVNSENWT